MYGSWAQSLQRAVTIFLSIITVMIIMKNLLLGVFVLIGLAICCVFEVISVSQSVVAGVTVVIVSCLLFLYRGSKVENKKYEGPLLNLYQTTNEHPEPREGTVIGSVPEWLCGRFFRSSPAIYEVGNTRVNHWFDGLGMLMCFNIRNGKCTLQSRYVRSDVYKKCLAANRIVMAGLGTAAYPDPCKTIFQRMMSSFTKLCQKTEKRDNTWVTTYPMGEDFIVASEGDAVFSFDPGTLETKKKIKHSKYMAVNTATAHAHYDPDGTVYNMGNSFKGRPYYNIIMIPPADKTRDMSPVSRGKVVCSIPAKYRNSSSYYHSFGMTEHYFVFVEIPYYVNLTKLFLNNIIGKPVLDAMKVYPNEQAQFHVVRRENGEILETRYLTGGFTFFHVINVYEDEDFLVLDLCGYDKFDYTFGYMEKAVKGSTEDLSTVRRFVLPLQQSKMKTGVNLVQLEYTTATAVPQQDGSVFCTFETLTNGLELPQINYRACRGKKYRYVYGIGDFNFVDGEKIVKLDVTTKAKTAWYEKNCFPSEPVFVAAPDAEGEDEGVLLSAVNRKGANSSPFLLILDASTMKELGRVVYEGVGIARGTHGMFSLQ